MNDFTHKGRTFSEAIDGLIAYDHGCTDSGIHDDDLKQAVKDYLRALPHQAAEATLAAHVRDHYLSSEAIQQGYGLEDVKQFINWMSQELHWDY
jgi:hypothetical protein